MAQNPYVHVVGAFAWHCHASGGGEATRAAALQQAARSAASSSLALRSTQRCHTRLDEIDSATHGLFRHSCSEGAGGALRLASSKLSTIAALVFWLGDWHPILGLGPAGRERRGPRALTIQRKTSVYVIQLSYKHSIPSRACGSRSLAEVLAHAVVTRCVLPGRLDH